MGYTVISRKVVGKNLHATIPEGNMGYDQYTFPNDRSCRTYFGCFPLAIANITSQTSRTILSNFFEEQCPQTHPQYLSGLSRAHFPTTSLEIAVYRCDCRCRCGSVSSAYLLFMKQYSYFRRYLNPLFNSTTFQLFSVFYQDRVFQCEICCIARRFNVINILQVNFCFRERLA